MRTLITEILGNIVGILIWAAIIFIVAAAVVASWKLLQFTFVWTLL